ncbi:MAG TPA: DUF402 domain-containing protein [Chloroflexi bacterium]|nr:DUF402 domain-containing protein [Chloroflexota bacterium]
MNRPEPITVIKADHTGREVWRYRGVVLERDSRHVKLEARFNRDDYDLGYATFRRNDRFVEYFYSDRWYNIFEIHDADDDHLKGWYCNFTRPARLDRETIRADDLALDLFVYPDRRVLILDREEFEALPLREDERAAVLAALEELQERVREGLPPFDGGRGGE